MQKKVSIPEVEQAVRWTREAGILSKGFFIIGSPLETKETFARSMAFARSITLDDMSLFKLTPFPGCQLYETADQYGAFHRDWKRMNLINTVFVPRDLTEEEMDRMSRKAIRDFYLRPRIIASYLRRVMGHPGYAGKILSGFKAFVKSSFGKG